MDGQALYELAILLVMNDNSRLGAVGYKELRKFADEQAVAKGYKNWLDYFANYTTRPEPRGAGNLPLPAMGNRTVPESFVPWSIVSE